MPVSRWGTRESSTSIPVPARAGISEQAQARPAAPMSWMPTMAGTGMEVEPELFGERVSHLHRRPALLRALVESGRRHRGAVNAVPAGLGTDVEDGIARPVGARAEDLVLLHEADGHGIDERVAGVLGSEIDLAAEVRDAEAVAVPADAG